MGSTASQSRSITVVNASFDPDKIEPRFSSDDGETACGESDFIPSADAYWKKRRIEQEAAHNAAESVMLRERQRARYEVRYRMRRYEHDKLDCEKELAAVTDCYNKSSKTSLNCSAALEILISCIDVKRRQRLDEEDPCSQVCGPQHWPI